MKWLCAFVLLMFPLTAIGQTATVNGSSTIQSIDGFGGQNGGAWGWASSPLNWNSLSSSQADALYSPSAGIGLSIYRTDNVDGTSSTLPPDMASLSLAYARGAQIELSMNSPPSSMKYSGHQTFGDGTQGASGSCLASSPATYATYIVQLIQNIQSSGSARVSFVVVQNEPNANGGTNTNGFGYCLWSASALDTMTQALGSALATAGLSPQIILGEAFNYSNSAGYFGTCIADSGCAPYVSIVSGHGYGYPDNPILYSASGKKFWQGETGDNNATTFNPGMLDTSSASGGLTLASNIDTFLATGEISSYNWWEIGYISNGGYCVNCQLVDQNWTLTKRYYVVGNWSKWVRPGQFEIAATHNPQSNVNVTAFKNTTTGAFEIVAVNTSSGSISQTFALSGLSASSVTPYITDNGSNNDGAQTPISISGGSFTATLNAYSVTTFVSSTTSNFTFSTAVSGTGTGSLACTPTPGTYASGTTGSCVATAGTGSTFGGFSGSICSGSTCAFTLTANGVVTGTFNATSGGTINAASCSSTDVQTAFNDVTSSTTLVTIPAQTCTWNTTVSLTVPAGSTTLTVQGQTNCTGSGNPAYDNLTCTDNTIINDGMSYSSMDPPLLTITTLSGAKFRMTGLTIQGNSSVIQTYNGALNIYGGSQQVRIDHNDISDIRASMINTGAGIAGVYDHNIIQSNPSGILFRIIGSTTGDFGGNIPWSQATGFGTSNFVFFEDNLVIGGANDCDRGGRWVMRFNTFVGSGDTLQFALVHPTGEPGGAIRGCRAWEWYGNNMSVPSGQPYAEYGAFLSSGSGRIWGNTNTDGHTQNFINLLSMRATNITYTQTATPNGWGYCGTNFSGVGSAWDQNSNTATGYRCLDQPGTGQTDLITPNGNFPTLTPAWPHQAADPIYEWMDKFTPAYGGPFLISSEGAANLVNNSDYYLWCDPASPTGCTTFDGTKGVGSGPLASMPSSCTQGVGYWATDQGTWNTSGVGPQGQFYICTSNNHWTLSYTPYAYPHPLVTGGGGGGSCTITSVTPSCSPASITVGQTSACTAAVVSAGSGCNLGVSWGATNGTINSSGLFAPTTTGAPFTANITATSLQDATKSGSTTVGVTAPASPAAPQLLKAVTASN